MDPGWCSGCHSGVVPLGGRGEGEASFELWAHETDSSLCSSGQCPPPTIHMWMVGAEDPPLQKRELRIVHGAGHRLCNAPHPQELETKSHG